MESNDNAFVWAAEWVKSVCKYLFYSICIDCILTFQICQFLIFINNVSAVACIHSYCSRATSTYRLSVCYTRENTVAYVCSWQMQFRLYWCVRSLVFCQWWWWWYFVFMSFRRTSSDGRNSDATYKLNLDSYICVQAFS